MVLSEFTGVTYNTADPTHSQTNSNQAEVLFKYRLFKIFQNDPYFSGIKLDFKNQFTNVESSILIGDTKGPSGNDYPFQESQVVQGKKIAKAYICNNATNQTIGLWFFYKDGTVVKNPQYFSACDGTNSYFIEDNGGNFSGTIRGLSLQRYVCNTSDFCIRGSQWKIFVDNNPCSLTSIPAYSEQPVQIVAMVGGGPVEHDLSASALWTNTYAYLQSNLAQCGTNFSYTFEDVFPSFLSKVGSKIIAQTTNSVDINIYGPYAMKVELQGYAISERINYFQVFIEACVVQAPVFSQAIYLVKIGIDSLSFNIAFTQPSLCQDSATLTTSPPNQEAWLSLVASNSQGGTIRVQGTTLTPIEDYQLTITNMGSNQWSKITLSIVDPCKLSAFETFPNPFSTITVDSSITSNVEAVIKVYTDMEHENSSIVCPITATITTANVSFVTISADSSKIIINAPLSASNIGIHFISIRVRSQNYASFVGEQTFQQKVVVNCIVNTLNISTMVTDFSYMLNSGNVIKGPFNPVQSPDCQLAVTWTNTHYSDGTLIGQATNFNTSTKSFTLFFTSSALIGSVQKFVLKAQIQQTVNGTTQQKYFEHSVLVTIQPDCLNTSFVDKPLDMSIGIPGLQTQSIFLQDTTANFHSSENFCGGRSYTFVNSFSFMTFDPNSQNLTLQSSNAADKGSYTFTFTVKLSSYASVNGFTKTINITITCTIQTLTFSPSTVTRFIEPGVTNQPQSQVFTITKSPNCANTVTFAFTASYPTFVVLTQNSDTATVKVEGALLAHTNVYPLVLRAQADGKSADANIQVEISDPCKRAIFEANSPLMSMDLVRNFDAVKTQIIVAKTDIETNYGLICSQQDQPNIAVPALEVIQEDILEHQNETWSFSAELVNPPTFVTLSGTTISVIAAQTTAQDVGSHQISVLVKSLTYPATVASKTYTFQLNVHHCVVNIMSSPVIASLSYMINAGPNSTSFVGATWSDLACQYQITYTVTLTGQSITPSWLTINGINKTVIVSTTSASDVGAYNLSLVSTIPQPSDASSIKQTTCDFVVTILSDCLNTQFVLRTISDIATKVMDNQMDQEIFIQDQKSVSYSNPNYCGPRIYTVTPSHAFLSVSGNTLTLKSTNVNEVGSYSIALRVKLQDYPDVPAFDTTFVATITCQIQTLTFSPSTATMFIEPGVTNQPQSQVFKITKSPNCANTVTFAFTASYPMFVVLTQTSDTATVKVEGAVRAHANVYPLVLRAQADGKSADANIQVEISDPCKRAIFEANSPLTSMDLVRKFDADKKQIIVAKTDIETNFGLICSFSAELVNPPTFVTLSGTTINVIAAQTTAQDVGSHQISVMVKSLTYPTTVTSKTYMFSLNVHHCVVNIMNSPSIGDLTFMINSGPISYNFVGATWSDQACVYPLFYALVFNGSSIVPNWLTLDGENRKITLTANSPLNVGLHNLILIAIISQPTEASGIKQVSTSFKITISSDCLNTQLVLRTISNIETKVMGNQTDQDIFIQDQKAVTYSNPNYCGPRIYTVTPSHAFLQVSGNTLRLKSTNINEVGSYSISLKVKLQNYTDVPAFDTTFVATILCEVDAIERIVSPPIRSKYRIKVDSPLQIPFQFGATTSLGFEYRLEPVLSFVLLSPSPDQKIQVATDDLRNSGIYKMKLFTSPSLPCYGITKVTEFELEIVNLCESTTFYNQAIPDMDLFREDPNYSEKQVIKFNDFLYEALQIYQLDCGPVKTFIKVSQTNQSVPEWIKLSKGRIDLNFSGLNKPFKLKLELVAQLEQYPDRVTTSLFQVSLSASHIICSENKPQVFYIESAPLKFGINYGNEEVKFGAKLTQVIKPVAFDLLGEQIALPAFVHFNEEKTQFEIYEIEQNDFSKLFVGLSVGYKEFPGFEIICKTQLTLTYQPLFEGSEIAKPELICGKPWSVHIPKYTDYFGKPALTTVNLGDAHEFLTYSFASRNITTGDFDTSNLESSYFTIEITNTDSQLKQKTQNIQFEILCNKGIKEIDDESLKWKPSELPQTNPPRPYISGINQFGQVRVSFTKPIIMPTFQQYPEFTIQRFMRQNCTNTTGEPDLCFDPPMSRRALKSAKIVNETKESIEIVNRGLVYENDILKPILNLKMIAGIDSNETQLNMTWTCEDFTPTYMDFKINYTYFQDVSIHDFKDKLEVKILGCQYFRSVDKNEYIEPSVAVMERSVPLQLSPELSQIFSTLTSITVNVAKVVLISQFLMNLLLGSALQQLLSAIRKIAIIVHLFLINVRIPANAQLFFGKLLEFVTFSIIDTEPIYRRMFNLYDTEEIDSRFLDLGYVSNYFIINMGDVLIALVYLLALLFFYYLTRKIQNPRLLRIRHYLTDGLIWNTILSFMMESYLLIVVSTVTNFRIFKFTSAGASFSLIYSMLGSVMLIVFPIFVLCFLQKKSKLLHLASYRQKYGTLYEILSLKKEGNKTLLEPFFTLMRILLTILSLILLKEYKYFQLFFSNFCMTFMVIYVGLSNCYVSKTMSFFEQFNESFVAIMNYHLMCFADFIQDEQTRSLVGWSIIGCISFNLFINMSYIVIDSIKCAFYKLRTAYYKAKLKRLKKLIALRPRNSIIVINNGNHAAQNQKVASAFPNRPQPFLIDAVLRDRNRKNHEDSLSNLVSDIDSHQISTNQQSGNLLLKPKLLPGQIPFKPNNQKILQKKVQVDAKAQIAKQDLEEEKVPRSPRKQSPRKQNKVKVDARTQIAKQDLEEEKIPSKPKKQSKQVEFEKILYPSNQHDYSQKDLSGPFVQTNLRGKPTLLKKRKISSEELYKMALQSMTYVNSSKYHQRNYQDSFTKRKQEQSNQIIEVRPNLRMQSDQTNSTVQRSVYRYNPSFLHNNPWSEQEILNDRRNPYLSGVAARQTKPDQQTQEQSKANLARMPDKIYSLEPPKKFEKIYPKQPPQN